MGHIDTERTFYLYWQGDAEGELRHGLSALNLISRDSRYTRSLANIYTAGALAITGQRNEALHLLEETLAEDCANGSQNADARLTKVRHQARRMTHY